MVALAAQAAPNGASQSYIPGRIGVRGTVPNPGTQQQELANITFPAPYNTFEFTVTCGACHAGTADQQISHFGNQSGTAMASSARDPVFRANQIGVNNRLRAVTGEDGAGNMCFRCHSPNGWYSGRFDPTLAGDAEGRTMMHSIVLSTDDEGVSCEQCHRVAGAAKYKPSNLDPSFAAWNLIGNIGGYPADLGWSHDGTPFVDQAGDPTMHPGAPYGDTTLQYSEGMTYFGPYAGAVETSFSDIPWPAWNATDYTGQIFAVYPASDPRAGQPVLGADNSIAPTYEQPIGAPIDWAKSNFVTNPPTLVYKYDEQAISIEHPTTGGPSAFITKSEFCGSCHDLTVPVLNHGMPEQRTYTEWKFSAYSQTTASALTGIPVAAGRSQGEVRCQDCHMPQLKHEYADDAPAAVNADPVITGWFPYTKDRNPNGGTSQHKHAGANRDLAAMMKLLYPQPDLELLGAPTGNDPRIFPGMLSTRDPMYDRNIRNTEISMADGVALEITAAPAETGVAFADGGVEYQATVKVINRTGHRIPTGYPDGRRMWVSLAVRDGAGAIVYRSGEYDAVDAKLYTDASGAKTLALAKTNLIDATVPGGNAVMIYERLTCRDGLLALDGVHDGICETNSSPDLLNNSIMFDNRIPPTGFTYADYRTGGVKFWNYTLAPNPNVGGALLPKPCEDAPGYSDSCPTATAQRYPDGQGFDLVTYRFTAAPGLALSARAEINWQTHTREYMEHLRDQSDDSLRPEGPLDPMAPGYPTTPNYLSDTINLATIVDPFRVAADGGTVALKDNWGGIAYAAWLKTGKGAPAVVASADTAVAAPPVAGPTGLGATPTPGKPYEATIDWDIVPGADGYVVYILNGCPLRPLTADGGVDRTRCFDELRDGVATATNSVSTVGVTTQWDRLAIVPASACDPGSGVCSLVNPVMNLNKTFGFKVAAFNAKGLGPTSEVLSYKTPWDIPFPPDLLRSLGTTATPAGATATFSWMDIADNESIFVVQYAAVTLANPQPVLSPSLIPINGGTGVAPPVVASEQVAVFATMTPGLMGFGGNQQTIAGLLPDTAYVVQVQACNAVACSGMNSNGPIQVRTAAQLAAPVLGLPEVVRGATLSVALNWSAVTGATGYIVERSLNGTWTAFAEVPATTFSDTTVTYNALYSYRVSATNGVTQSSASNVQTATTPPLLNAPAIGKVTGPNTSDTVAVRWVYANQGQTGFSLERASTIAGVVGPFIEVAVFGPTVRSASDVLAPMAATQGTANVYVYRVVALQATVQGTIRSDPSASSTPVTQLPAATAAPNNLILLPVAGGFSVQWNDRSLNELGFTIQRQVRNTNGTWGSPLQFDVAAQAATGLATFPDLGLTAGKVYRYRVRAFNDRGTSGWTGYQSRTY